MALGALEGEDETTFTIEAEEENLTEGLQQEQY